MSYINVSANTPISLNGKYGSIRFADSDAILMGFEDGKTQTIRPKEFRDWLRMGKLKIAKRTETTLLKVFKNKAEEEKFLFVKECVDKMDMHPNPYSRDFIKQTLLEVACKLGWPGGVKFGDSTLISYYDNWKREGRDYNYMLSKRKPENESKRKVTKAGLRYEVAEAVFQNYYLKLNGPTEIDALRKYQADFYKEVERVRAEFGDKAADKLGKPLGKSSFNNFIKSFNPYEVMKSRKGTRAALRYFRQKGTKTITSFPLERIEVDALHLQIGLKVWDETLGEEKIYKPIIYIAFDVHTRLVVGYHISVSEKASETSNAVVQLIKHMVNPFKESQSATSKWPLSGAPDEIFSDCGSAFIARWVRSLVSTIKATHHMCPAASPWKKPFVERFNGTIKTKFAPQMTGYVGNRKRGEVMDGTLESLAVLTREEFENEFERFILDYYHHAPHRGLDNKTPLEFFDEIKHLSLSTSLDLHHNLDGFAGWDKEMNLTETGVQYKNLRYYSEKLGALRSYLVVANKISKGHPKVTVLIDDSDVSKISVIDDRDNELFVVQCQSQTVEEGCYRHELEASRKPRNEKGHMAFVSNVGKSAKSSASTDDTDDKTTSYQSLEDELTEDEVEGLITNGNGLGARDFSSLTPEEDSTESDPDFNSSEDHIDGDFDEYLC
jgi:putative transposase